MKKTMRVMVVAGLLVVSVGCRTTCERHPWCRSDPPPAPVYVPPPPPAPYLQPQPIQQSGGFPVVQPGAVVNPPPGARFLQPAEVPSISKTPASNVPQWKPAESSEPPLPESRRDAPPRIQLYAPEPIDNPAPAKEPIDKKPGAQRSLPAIPQFAEAKEKVYAGLRPPLDGLDWLQEEGVRTIVNIRLPSKDDSADQEQVEKRKMRYVAFEVTPDTLTKEQADEFVKLIRDGARQGIFVYDQDGSLAGSMWYLYLRTGEVLDDDASQLRARSLGLPADRDGQHREMWLAVKRVLNENSR